MLLLVPLGDGGSSISVLLVVVVLRKASRFDMSPSPSKEAGEDSECCRVATLPPELRQPRALCHVKICDRSR